MAMTIYARIESMGTNELIITDNWVQRSLLWISLENNCSSCSSTLMALGSNCLFHQMLDLSLVYLFVCLFLLCCRKIDSNCRQSFECGPKLSAKYRHQKPSEIGIGIYLVFGKILQSQIMASCQTTPSKPFLK